MLRKTFKLLFRRAGSDHEIVQFLRVSCFDQQGSLDDGDGVRLGAFDGFKLAVLRFQNMRVHDCVQSRESCRICKHDGTQLFAIHAAIGSKDAAAKFVYDVFVGRCAGLD